MSVIQSQNRFTWAASIIAPSPDDHILEIGCGAGILVEQIALKLKSGTITAIDQSKSMIKLAEKRNEEYIRAGKVKLLTSNFAQSTLARQAFDKVVAFNVNIFWKGSKNDFDLLHFCLKPAGSIFVFYQAPSGADPGLAAKITAKLQANSFSALDTIYAADCFCIICKPA